MPTVISLRSLAPLYNVETLVQAIPHVLKDVPDTHFIIAGEGSERRRLEQLAESLGIQGHVAFIGQVPNEQLSNHLCHADVYVSTSLSDSGLSISTCEALACGVPVVVSDSGENRKWINGCGFVVPVKDSKALADRIVFLLRDEGLRKRFGVAGRRMVVENLDYEGEMGKMEAIYKEMKKRVKE